MHALHGQLAVLLPPRDAAGHARLLDVPGSLRVRVRRDRAFLERITLADSCPVRTHTQILKMVVISISNKGVQGDVREDDDD